MRLFLGRGDQIAIPHLRRLQLFESQRKSHADNRHTYAYSSGKHSQF